ncbi:MAG: sugar-binding protein [Trueperaceae bacterium]
MLKVLFMVLMLLVSFSFAQESVSATNATITVDGDLADWTGEPTVSLDLSMISKDQPDITDENDYSAQVYVSYDDENMYLGANVLDDATVFERGGDQLYQTDALEFWLNNNQYAVAMSEGQAVLHQFSFGGVQGDLSATQVAFEYTDTGYALEVAIPLAVVSEAAGSDIAAGASLPFALGGDDTDTPGLAEEEAREGQLYWPSGWEWGKPETYATLTLAE